MRGGHQRQKRVAKAPRTGDVQTKKDKREKGLGLRQRPIKTNNNARKGTTQQVKEGSGAPDNWTGKSWPKLCWPHKKTTKHLKTRRRVKNL